MIVFYSLKVPLIFGEGNGTPLQYSCLENHMDAGAWRAAVHGVARSRTQLSDFTLFFHFHALEKEMATHSSVLAWRIPGTGEPGGLPSMGSHRVGHDWSDLAAAAAIVAVSSPSPVRLLWPHGQSSLAGYSPWGFPGKNTGVGCHFLLPEIFPTQESNPHLLYLLYCRRILNRLSHWGSL